MRFLLVLALALAGCSSSPGATNETPPASPTFVSFSPSGPLSTPSGATRLSLGPPTTCEPDCTGLEAEARAGLDRYYPDHRPIGAIAWFQAARHQASGSVSCDNTGRRTVIAVAGDQRLAITGWIGGRYPNYVVQDPHAAPITC
jgi:hypothetical protein